MLAGMLVLAPALAQANDASFYGDGATVFAVKETRVAMEREAITIRFDREATSHTVQWVATCVFTFRNLTDQSVEVQMGFPDWMGAGDDGGQWAIRDFQVNVRGKRVRAVHKAVEEGAGQMSEQMPNQVKLEYEAAYTWKVRFEPGETVTVENTYRFGGFSSNGPFSACVWNEKPERLGSVFWRKARKPKGGWDFEDGVCKVVSYVVTTGRTWARPIGVADIAIELPPGTWPHAMVPLPAATQVDQGWVRWHFENFSPTEELRVVLVRPMFREDDTWLPLFDTPAQAKAWVRFAAQNGFGKDMVEQVRRAYELRHGLVGPSQDPALAVLPEALPEALIADWGPRPTGKATRLSANEKRITAILRGYVAPAVAPAPAVAAPSPAAEPPVQPAPTGTKRSTDMPRKPARDVALPDGPKQRRRKDEAGDMKHR
jgi:hypothetical protein